LDLDKDVLSLLEAIPLIHARHPQAQFVFVGSGPKQAQIESRIAQAPWGRQVRLVGFQPTPVVRAFLAHASVVWIPKAGFALLEAAAAGTALVAYDIEWQRELIEDGRTGRLVPYLDTARLAQAVCELLDQPQAAARMQAAIRQTMASRFHPSAIAAQEVEIYRELLAGQGGRG
jgi:glycogen(starch) synthase